MLFAGFFFPLQLATLMNAEVRDLLKVQAPLILPIFGGTISFCYPALPVRIALGNKNFALLKYVHDDANVSHPEKEHASMPAPMAYTMLKTENLVLFNVEKIRRVHTNKKYDVANEVACVEWVQGS